MKRLTIALATIGLSSTIFAALPATTDPTLVAVPQLPGGFVIGATGYYLQPSFTHGDLNYAVAFLSTTSPFGSHLKAIDPGYDWGWGANLGYIFPNTGNDINLSYFHFDSDDHSPGAFGFPAGNLFTTADFEPAIPVIVPFFFGQAQSEHDLDRVDLTVGQYIDVGCRLSIHPSVGVSYLSLDRKLNSTYFGTTTGVFGGITLETFTDHTIINEKSEFEGIGPLSNIDASYYLGYGFGLVGHADAGLYVGDIEAKTNALRAAQDFINPPPRTFSAVAINSLSSESNTQIAPFTDIKLGIDYTYLFNNAANSNLTLEVGYQTSHYFNAVERLNSQLSNLILNPAGTAFSVSAPSIISRTTSDFSLSGPYASLTIHV